MKSFYALGQDLMLVHDGNRKIAHALAGGARVLTRRLGRLLVSLLRDAHGEHSTPR